MRYIFQVFQTQTTATYCRILPALDRSLRSQFLCTGMNCFSYFYLQRLRSSEVSLLSCGYKQEAIDVKCERAAILRRLAANSKTKADRRKLYLEALTLLGSAVRLCDVLSTEIASLCSPEEVCFLV